MNCGLLWMMAANLTKLLNFQKTILAPFFDTHIRSSWYSFSVLLLGKVVWRICVRLAELAVLDRIRFLMGLIWLATSSIYIYKDISKSFSRKMPPIIHDFCNIKKKLCKNFDRIHFKNWMMIICCSKMKWMTGNFFFLF